MSDPATPDVEMADSWWEHRADAFGAWAEQIDPADLEPADTGALQAIARLTDLRREIETAILEAVQHARQQRRTWAEIGAMLGVTRQAAQHKYAPALASLQSETSTQQKISRRLPTRRSGSAFLILLFGKAAPVPSEPD